jgi:hypothetical protein
MICRCQESLGSHKMQGTESSLYEYTEQSEYPVDQKRDNYQQDEKNQVVPDM